MEDDDAIRALLAAALRRGPLEVDTANDGAAALQMTRDVEYAVILLDLMMPRMNGFEFLEAFHRATPKRRRSVILVVTAFDDAKVGKLQPSQVHAIVKKPFDVTQIVAMIREVATLWETQLREDVERVLSEVAAADDVLPAEPAN